MMTDLQQATVVALTRVQRRLAPPRLAARDALAFLELPPHVVDEDAVVRMIVSKVRAPVIEGLWDRLRGWQTESQTTLHRIGRDLVDVEFGEQPRHELPPVEVEALFTAWVEADPHVMRALYLDLNHAA